MALHNIGEILNSQKQIGGTQLETAIAKAYLISHVHDFDRVDFNVGLGPGLDLGGAYPPYVQAAATASTKPRADMILWRGEVPTIVEVKGRIGPSAMGQLLTYWHIMREDNPKLLNVYKAVAGQTIQAGLPAIFERYGIHVELFPGVSPVTSTNS